MRQSENVVVLAWRWSQPVFRKYTVCPEMEEEEEEEENEERV